MQKGSKEYFESKQKAREELDLKTFNEEAYMLRDSTVGHIDGPAGTWNTSGVEVPMDATRVRDVRPETRDAVSLEGLKELGVPVRDESDYSNKPVDAPVVTAPETQDRTLEIKAAREAVEAEDKESAKEDKKTSKK